MVRLGLVTVILGGLLACTGSGGGGTAGTVAATCGEAECAAVCADGDAGSAGPELTEFEKKIVDPILADVREGVRPWSETGIGICKGKRECEEFLGASVADPLPAGDYLLMADLRVPRTGDAHTWTIEVTTDCETVKVTENGETKSSSSNSRSYDVRYAGEERGYRLMPLRTITSPSDGGSRHCTYTIKAPHPDGEKVYTGSWSTPDAGS